MPSVAIAYGDGDVRCEFPAGRTVVVEPTFEAAHPRPDQLLRDALARPIGGPRLRDLVQRGQSVAISVCDITRPQPRRPVVGAILEELDGVVSPAEVVVLVATGSHRSNTPEELEAMLGADIIGACRVVNHDARDDASLRYLGVAGDGVPVWLNALWVDAPVRITTGFVEPHFFAGFSGGPKMVAPGLAGLDTILTLHDGRRIAHPNATWAVCEGNPVHDDVRAIASATGVTFSVDVVLNRDKQITHAFAGALEPVHLAARRTCKRVSMRPVDALFDVVVTSNSGYPLDQNLYQAVKGMSAAMNVVKPGGTIVCAAECRDGVPDHGSYGELLGSAASIEEVAAKIVASDRTIPDQWQVQVQARVQARARVLLRSDGLDDRRIVASHLEPCPDIEATVSEELRRFGDGARVCVLPDGPQTIPYLAVS